MNAQHFNETAYWLSLIFDSGLKLSQLKPLVQKWHLQEGRPVIDLFNLSALELSTRFDIEDELAQRLLQAAESQPKHLKQVEQWAEAGIQVLHLSHAHYPQRLIYNLPPQQQPLVLWARGDTSKLADPTITVLGKPDPDPETVIFVQALAQILVSENIGVVSGYGKGLDRTAFESILDLDGGQAVAVLPMGLRAFSHITTKLDDAVNAEKAILLSPFSPDIKYKDSYAEARNLLVDSLAFALLVPNVDSESLPRAEAALERALPVLVGMTNSAENRDLITKGAFLMTDPGEVVDMVQQAIIDNAMQAEIAQTPAAESPPPPQDMLADDSDDYSLRSEPVETIDPDEALEIFASMGNVPTSLREKLMRLEQENQDDEA